MYLDATVQNCAKRCKTVQNSSAVPSASGMPCSEFKFTVRWWGLVHWVWPTDKFWFSLTPFPPPSCWSPNLHQNLAKKYPRGPTGTPFEHLHNAPHTLPQISYEITPPLLLTLSSSDHDNQYCNIKMVSFMVWPPSSNCNWRPNSKQQVFLADSNGKLEWQGLNYMFWFWWLFRLVALNLALNSRFEWHAELEDSHGKSSNGNFEWQVGLGQPL